MGRRNTVVAAGDLRERLAQSAAKLMMESGIEDFGFAKRKAAERLGVRDAGVLPSNSQIAAALAERQRIFEPDAHQYRIGELRRSALAVMDVLASFEPRLVGPVLAGTATIASAIELHVFSDTPEAVLWTLADHGVAARDCERRFRFGSRGAASVPAYRFVSGSADVVAVVFPENGVREAPLSPVDRRPMRRAGRAEVAQLVDAAPAQTDAVDRWLIGL